MPTASDMARLGSTLISGHRQRNVEIAGMRTEAREFLGHLRDQDAARRGAVQEHAAETGRFVGQLHAETQARKRDMRRHAAQTGRFVGQLHDLTRGRKARNRATMRHLHGQDMARRDEVQEHAARTGRFVGQLHDMTRQRKGDNGSTMRQLRNQDMARRRDVQRHAVETARFVRYLHGVTRERKHEVGQLLGQARELMAGLSVITRKAQAEWRRQLVVIDSGRRTASAGRGASPRGGTAFTGAESKAGGRGQESNRDVGSLVAAYVARHPGTRLPEMEKALGINRIEAAKGVRALLDQGTVRRDEETRQYFPA